MRNKFEIQRCAALIPLYKVRYHLSSVPFWIGTLYFMGLFSCFLALEDLWNIRFQVDVFAYQANLATSINAMPVSGLTIGGVLSGLWAERCGLERPARLFSILALLMMAVLLSVQLSQEVAFVVFFVLGLGLGAAPLGLLPRRKLTCV